MQTLITKVLLELLKQVFYFFTGKIFAECPQSNSTVKWYDGQSLNLNFGCIGFHYTSRMKFHDAERFCKSLGAHLVEFHTKAQYDFLMKYGKKAGGNGWYWIGLKQKQGAWYWIHSKTKLNSFFQKKVKGAASSGNYMMIHRPGKWHKVTEDYKYSYPLCQKMFD